MTETRLVPTRTDLLSYVPRWGRIVELGVFEGDFSRQILACCDPAELHLVDLWRGPMQCGDKDGQHIRTLSDAQMGRIYTRLCRTYAQSGVVTLHRQDVMAALSSFPDSLLDFVYVDADHHYDATRAHLEAAASKIKPGGFLGGHDYGAPYLGVVQAVDEFVRTRRAWTWIAQTTDDGCPSFLLRRLAA